VIAFFDSSALVPLVYAQEPFTRAAKQQLVVASRHAASFLVPLEARSAFRRLLRERKIADEAGLEGILRQLGTLLEHFDLVAYSDERLREAEKLVDRHPLQALDALQLACAKWLEQGSASEDFVFVTADRRLGEAAGAEFLTVVLLE
jgi:predicted nucleic acid-binding protein